MIPFVCGLLGLMGCDRGRSSRGPFDGEAALGYAKAQLDFGPRVPGTAAHRSAGDWIVARMRERADTVIEQTWTHVTVDGDSLPMRNILARFRPEAAERVLYVAHWDSRPRSESAAEPERQSLPVPGANDGASGVALMIALGDVLKAAPPTLGVDLLFVDGEDYGDFSTYHDVLIGSIWFADHLPSADYAPLFGVLWDMVGDRDLQIFQERNSLQGAPEVVKRVWDTADDLGYGKWFVAEPKHQVTDDHIPLLRKGLRVIDVIDFDYAHHHTPDDTLDKISAQSLKIVGDVAYALLSGR